MERFCRCTSIPSHQQTTKARLRTWPSQWMSHSQMISRIGPKPSWATLKSRVQMDPQLAGHMEYQTESNNIEQSVSWSNHSEPYRAVDCFPAPPKLLQAATSVAVWWCRFFRFWWEALWGLPDKKSKSTPPKCFNIALGSQSLATSNFYFFNFFHIFPSEDDTRPWFGEVLSCILMFPPGLRKFRSRWTAAFRRRGSGPVYRKAVSNSPWAAVCTLWRCWRCNWGWNHGGWLFFCLVCSTMVYYHYPPFASIMNHHKSLQITTHLIFHHIQLHIISRDLPIY